MIEQQAGQRILMPDGMSARVIMPRGVAAVPSWWLAAGVNPLAAYQAKGMANYAASLVNLFTPGTYDLIENNGAVTWDAVNGWQFVLAQSKSFNTGITPVNNQTWSMFVQFVNAAGVNPRLCGCRTAANADFYLAPSISSQVRYANGGTLSVSPALTSGNLGISGAAGYRNGTADAGAISAPSGVISHSAFIGAYNVVGSATSFVTGTIVAVIIFNLTLTGPQAALIAAAMAAL